MPGDFASDSGSDFVQFEARATPLAYGVTPAAKAHIGPITQGLIWGVYTSPAVIKPEAIRPFAPEDILALLGDSFCLQNQACNFPSPSLSLSVPVSVQPRGSVCPVTPAQLTFSRAVLDVLSLQSMG